MYCFSFCVEPRRDEQPDLVEHVGRGQDAATHKANLEVEVKGVHRVVVDQLRLQVVALERHRDRLLHEGVNALVEAVGDKEADDQGDDRVHDAPAQLFQVFDQAHAW